MWNRFCSNQLFLIFRQSKMLCLIEESTNFVSEFMIKCFLHNPASPHSLMVIKVCWAEVKFRLSAMSETQFLHVLCIWIGYHTYCVSHHSLQYMWLLTLYYIVIQLDNRILKKINWKCRHDEISLGIFCTREVTNSRLVLHKL